MYTVSVRFGELIRKLRDERNLLVQELASRSNFSIGTISQIERGILIPVDDTAKRVIDALEKGGKPIDDNTRVELYSALLKDRTEKENKPKESLAFGNALRDLLKKLGLSGSDLTSRPRSTINAWVTGTLLPGDKALVEELIPELERLGASTADVQALKLAHLRDILSKSLALIYLNMDAQEKVANAAISKAKNQITS